MIRDASRADLPALSALLTTSNEAPYDIGPVLVEKCFEPGFGGEARCFVYEQAGEVVGVAVVSGHWLRLLCVSREHRRRGIGSALLARAEEMLLGQRRIVAAAEAGNYFTPGVVESDKATSAFLLARGFREYDDTWNLDVELCDDLTMPEGVRRVTEDDRQAVLDYISRQFGLVWRFESAHSYLADPPAMFIVEHEGKIVGFSAHEANNRGLGTFGPTGVTPSMRRRGLGRKLLMASLADLYRMGFRKAVIPWTDAFEFYRDCCGARKTHRFVTYVK